MWPSLRWYAVASEGRRDESLWIPIAAGAQVRLLIIDEVHLLNDERGPVRRASGASRTAGVHGRADAKPPPLTALPVHPRLAFVSGHRVPCGPNSAAGRSILLRTWAPLARVAASDTARPQPSANASACSGRLRHRKAKFGSSACRPHCPTTKMSLSSCAATQRTGCSTSTTHTAPSRSPRCTSACPSPTSRSVRTS